MKTSIFITIAVIVLAYAGIFTFKFYRLKNLNSRELTTNEERLEAIKKLSLRMGLKMDLEEKTNRTCFVLSEEGKLVPKDHFFKSKTQIEGIQILSKDTVKFFFRYFSDGDSIKESINLIMSQKPSLQQSSINLEK